MPASSINSRVSKGRRTRSETSARSSHEVMFFVIIAAFSFISVTLNVIHHQAIPDLNIPDTHPHIEKPNVTPQESVKEVQVRDRAPKDEKGAQVKADHDPNENLEAQKDNDEVGGDHHTIGGISCKAFGGPDDEFARKEMVYWSDVPSDAKYVSPFKKNNDANNGPTQYMTFEPDGGGWNNIRMAMETVVVMAHAMGRTLVLPPAQGMYLLRKDKGKQNIHFSFADFFHLESLSREHDGLDIITMEEFLKKEAMTGNLRNKTSGEVSFPPNNRTNWDGEDPKPLKEWMREVTMTPLWKPEVCLAAFPASGDTKDIDDLHEMIKQLNENKIKTGHDPVAVDAKPVERMSQIIAGRRELCVYDEEMQKAPVLHFMCYHKMRVRLLTHFYAFLFFEDWKQQAWEYRFVRDHLRYLDELQCAAARVVGALREIAKKQTDNQDGVFDTFHIRRGDFQYKDTRLEADELFARSKDLIPEKAVLYIATDERKKIFFDVFKEHYDVYFLDDFKHLFEGLNTNYYGMLDQIIASKGRTFVGTYYSTFTGYINRMRGYHAVKDKLDGHEVGKIESYYFHPVGKKDTMTRFTPVARPFFSREYPVSWMNIDKGISEL